MTARSLRSQGVGGGLCAATRHSPTHAQPNRPYLQTRSRRPRTPTRDERGYQENAQTTRVSSEPHRTAHTYFVEFFPPAPPNAVKRCHWRAAPNQETVAGERQYFGDRQAKLTARRCCAGFPPVQIVPERVSIGLARFHSRRRASRAMVPSGTFCEPAHAAELVLTAGLDSSRRWLDRSSRRWLD